MRKIVAGAVVMTALLGCAEEEAMPKTTAAVLTSKLAMNPTLSGLVTFAEQGDAVKVTVSISDAPPGRHGLHIHEAGSCADNDAGAAGAAGGHWNPTMSKHGDPDEMVHHLGDLGNIVIDENRRGQLTISLRGIKVGDPYSLLNVNGKAVVLHAMEDDLMTDPSGNSGARIACGVIAP